MAAQPARRKFTVDEYYRMGDVGILKHDERVELIKGEIYRMPPIGVPHASHVGRISHLFSRAFLMLAQIWVQNPLRLSDLSEPVPDVMLLRPRPDFYAERHPNPEDVFVLVEISDTTLAFDQRTKVPLYARHGVPELWVVDLNHDLIHVYQKPTATGYQITETRRRGDGIAVAAFPEIEFAVEEVLG
jgi:Uma2 family endonuclease